MADNDSEKTEEATERQVQRFRDEGKVVQSRDLVSAVMLAIGALALIASVPMFAEAVLGLLRHTRGRVAEGDLDTVAIVSLAAAAARGFLPPLLLILCATAVGSVATGLAITGFNLAPDTLTPKLERLDPIASAKAMYGSAEPWVQLGKGVLVGAALVWAAWGCIEERLPAIPALPAASLRAQLGFTRELLLDFAQRVIPMAVAVGAADLMWRRWKLSQDMMMAREDVKREHKENEGDPQVRSQRKRRQRQLSMGKQVAAVRTADVVVTNPTHYAIALAYRRERHAAPVVVARGVDHLALRIRAEAVAHGVAVIENRPLARALYGRCTAGRPIPAGFYGPVAQVLAVVFRRRSRRAASGVSG